MPETLQLASDAFENVDLEPLYLDAEAVEKAYALASAIELDQRASGRQPASIAAACVYVVAKRAGDSRGRPSVAECFGVSQGAIINNEAWVADALDDLRGEN